MAPSPQLRIRAWFDRDLRHRLREDAAYDRWVASGRPGPAPHRAKQDLLRGMAIRYRLRTLVETGTFEGDMVWALRDIFAEIHSIELGEDLYRRAVARFRPFPHIHLYQGDSGKVLAQIVPVLTGPALFWLDGHYSAGHTARGDKDTPILEELDIILRRPPAGHIVLIDDARCFNGTSDYPTLDTLRRFVGERRPDLTWRVDMDCIQLLPPAPSRPG